MQSRRDLVQAQAYLNGRLASALVQADPDASETPTRRTSMGMLIGVALLVVAVLGAAGFALIFGGRSDQWREPGAFIIDRDTGSRYVLADGTLRPVLNLASAKLLLGTSMRVVRVAHGSLEGTPHGPTVGIPGAPEVLPGPGLRTNVWQACATGSAAGDERPVALSLGTGPAPGARELAGDEAFWVTGPDDDRYLLWRGQRLRAAAPALANALGYTEDGASRVAAGLLNMIPAGPDLTGVDVAGRGRPAAVLGGTQTRTGQVLVVQSPGAPDRFLLQTGTGLAALSTVDAQLVLADPATREAYPGQQVRALPLSVAAAASAARSTVPGREGLPTTPPRLVAEPGAGPCAELTSRADGYGVRLLAGRPAGGRPPAAEPAITVGPEVAASISVTPSGGALVRPRLASGAPGLARYLVTDLGVKYPVTSAAAEALGLPPAEEIAVPAGVLDLLPTGPELALPS
ncbi:MAG TPA: type VII secretion protein EccB [Actinophytocola sp.]|uniref:type VII secretion protein EccB n=1 Tax=Actinophytocola sp. TaxID=1872138 RepID=UPI002DF96CF0|nr:type VII secretion protein EccB [Actinophytocola sp.]